MKRLNGLEFKQKIKVEMLPTPNFQNLKDQISQKLAKPLKFLTAPLLGAMAISGYYSEMKGVQEVACLALQPMNLNVLECPKLTFEQYTLAKDLCTSGEWSGRVCQQVYDFELKQKQTILAQLDKANRYEKLPIEAQINQEKAVSSLIQTGSEMERAAMNLIAKGQVEEGFESLLNQATEQTTKAAEKWRKIGKIAFSINVKQGIQAYQKIIKMGEGTPEDHLSLIQLFIISGNTDNAKSTAQTLFVKLNEITFSQSGAKATSPEQLDAYRAKTHQKLAQIYDLTGEADKAQSHIDLSISKLERLKAHDPNNFDWLMALSISYEILGQLKAKLFKVTESINSYEKTLALRQQVASEDASDVNLKRLADAYTNLGEKYGESGSFGHAFSYFNKSLSIIKTLLERAPTKPIYISSYAEALTYQGHYYSTRGLFQEAKSRYIESLSLYEKLVTIDPNNTEWKYSLVGAISNVSWSTAASGQVSTAINLEKRKETLLISLLEQTPSNTLWDSALFNTYSKLGEYYLQQGKIKKAHETYLAAKRISNKSPEQYNMLQKLLVRITIGQGQFKDARKTLKNALLNSRENSNKNSIGSVATIEHTDDEIALSHFLLEMNDAITAYQYAAEITHQLNTINFSENHKNWVAIYQYNANLLAAKASLNLNDHSLSETHYKTAYKAGKAILSEGEKTAWFDNKIFKALNGLAKLRIKQGKWDDAFNLLTQSEEVTRSFLAKDNSNSGWNFNLISTLHLQSEIWIKQNKLNNAAELYEEIKSIQLRFVTQDPTHGDWQYALSNSYDQLANIRKKQNDKALARKLFREAYLIRKTFFEQDNSYVKWQEALTKSIANIQML